MAKDNNFTALLQFMPNEEVLIIWLVCATILLLLFIVATIFCGIALYYRFDKYPRLKA